MLKLFFTGNLSTDPKTGTTKAGKQACSFDVAPRNAQFFNMFAGKDDGKQLYVHVNAYGKTAELCAKYLVNGRFVAIVGNATQFTIYKSPKYGDARLSIQVNADDVEFGNNATRPPVPENAGEAPQKEPDKNFVPEGFVEVSPDELPF